MTDRQDRNGEGQSLDEALRLWANERPGEAAFVSKLAAIAQSHPQRTSGLLRRIIGAMGGWGFATPQLAGLAVAAWLGVVTGNQAQVQEDLVSEAMSQHIFGAEESFEG